MNASYKIVKRSGNTEDFSEAKLCNSLKFAGASEEQAHRICSKVYSKCFEQASSSKIYNQAFNFLKKENKAMAAHYSFAKTVQELGPDGYNFEQFIRAIMERLGYQASTNHIKKGRCVKHEIDVIGIKGEEVVYCECKFHNRATTKNDLKTALYIQARSDDLKANPDNNLTQFWLVSNTKFSKDAIDYATCVGLKIFGPNFPRNNAIADLARKTKVHPITCLTGLRKKEARILLDKKVILTSQILNDPTLLNCLDLDVDKKKDLLTEIKNLESFT